MNWTSIIPNLVTTSRIAMIPCILIQFKRGNYSTAILLFIAACVTDLLDGYAARKLKASTTIGAYLDSIADLLLIISLLTYFISVGTVSPLSMAFIGFMFLQFLITSVRGNLVYDPVGKYTGVMLFAVVLLLLICPTGRTGKMCDYIISLYISGAFFLRILFLKRRISV